MEINKAGAGESQGDASPGAMLDLLDSRKKSGSRPSVFTYIDQSKRVPHISWKDLSFSVSVLGAKVEILKCITGHLKPGQLTCILGPSGSGKTSLLNILAGRVRPGGRNSAEIGGKICVNGVPFEPSKCQHLFGYVMQEDALFATATPREIFKFSAGLRLGVTDKAALQTVLEDMINSLGLKSCADSMVGSELLKGISGGEKKRTAIGQELITNPQVTFLDEPTSGLDSEAAFSVVQVLKELTRVGQAVLCTIHQPSSETFFLFEKAIFLARGRVMYAGPLNEICMHFNSLGCPVPENYNPADFLLFAGKHADGPTMQKFVGSVSDDFPDADDGSGSEAIKSGLHKGKGFFAEFKALSRRELLMIVRDKATMGARFGSTIFLITFSSLIFFQIGNREATRNAIVARDGYDLQSHNGATIMIGINAMLGAAQPLLLTFSMERPIFLRERASNTYGSAPYFLSKTAAEIPLILLQMLVQWAIAYPMMGMSGRFDILWLSSVLIGLVSASVGLLVGCAVKDAKTAVELAPAVFVPQILFGGFFIKMERIPVWLRWLQYLFPLKWGMNILMIAEFEGTPEGDALLRMNDTSPDQLGFNIGVLLGLFVAFRLFAMFILMKKAKALYN